MSEWVHRMCGECWLELELQFHEDGSVSFRPPVMVKDDAPGRCCYCGQRTRLGIYKRASPEGMRCTHARQEKALANKP